MSAKTNGKSLIDFWQSPIAAQATSIRFAADLATACREVLAATPAHASINLRTYPSQEILDRFEAERKEYRRQTLAAYKSRFRKAVRLYLAYVDHAGDWPPQLSKQAEQGSTLAAWQQYRFPLRHASNVSPGRDGLVSFELPLDLARSEAKRLAAFIESLVLAPVVIAEHADVEERLIEDLS